VNSYSSTNQMNTEDWVVWQLIDSSFPSGGFVHSGGVEAAAQLGFIQNRAGLDSFLQQQLKQMLHSSLKLMMRAFKSVDRGAPFEKNIQSYAPADHLAQATTVNHISNRASRAQGSALLSTASQCFPESGLSSFKSRAATHSLYHHYPPVFGLVCCLMGIKLDVAQRMFMFVSLRGLLSSAIRLNLVGPIEGQNVHHKYSLLIEKWLKESSLEDDPESIYQAFPLLDIMQGAHDRLYSRLFNT